MLNSSNLMSAQMGSIPVGSLFQTDVQSLWTCEIDDVQRPGIYWSDDRCKEYIQSICSGLAPTPLVFAARDSSSPRRIIDGQHRVNAIRRFINGEILLPKGSNERYSSVTLRPFSTWDEESQRRFFNEKLIVSLFLPKAGVTLTDESWWDEKALLFKNLNSSRPVSGSDITRLECRCEDAPFNKIMEDIIYYDDTEGDYVFKQDKGSRCAFQTLTLCGYSYILGEITSLYPNARSGSNSTYATKGAVYIKKTIYSVVGQKELEDRIGKMRDALLSSRHTKPMPRVTMLTAKIELHHSLIALSGLLNVRRAEIDKITSALLNNVAELSRSSCESYCISNIYRVYLSELKSIYRKNKKITASDMLTAAAELKVCQKA